MDDRLERYSDELESKNDMLERELKPKKFTKKHAKTLLEMIRGNK